MRLKLHQPKLRIIKIRPHYLAHVFGGIQRWSSGLHVGPRYFEKCAETPGDHISRRSGELENRTRLHRRSVWAVEARVTSLLNRLSRFLNPVRHASGAFLVIGNAYPWLTCADELPAFGCIWRATRSASPPEQVAFPLLGRVAEKWRRHLSLIGRSRCN